MRTHKTFTDRNNEEYYDIYLKNDHSLLYLKENALQNVIFNGSIYLTEISYIFLLLIPSFISFILFVYISEMGNHRDSRSADLKNWLK